MISLITHGQLWIGGAFWDMGLTAEWRWTEINMKVTDGYQNWNSGSHIPPVPSSGSECMVYVMLLSQWAPHPCNELRPYVCEYMPIE